MKTAALPAPNGTPAIIGAIQWTFGVHVHAKIISPTGMRMAARHTTDTYNVFDVLATFSPAALII
jgi:hypothetical protein